MSPIRTSSGEIIGASTIVRDLSRSQHMERDALRLASIVDSSDDAIVSKDLHGIITSWNAAAERMFGYTALEMVGQSIRRIIPDDRQLEEDEVLSRIRRGERVEHYETIRRRKDGTLLPVSLTVSPIKTADGTIVGASKIARDVSDRQRAEQERQRLLAIARDASRLKDEFLATLSHELRTPLNAIVGYVRMMQEGLLTGEKRARALDTVERNVTSLTRIVEDVLDVSRIISGKIRLDVQPVDLSPVIDNALESVRPAANAKGVRLIGIVDPRSAHVSGDPERLQQILWNILSNAVKFTERGGLVQVRLEQVNSHVEITVSDTGSVSRQSFSSRLRSLRQVDAGITGRVVDWVSVWRCSPLDRAPGWRILPRAMDLIGATFGSSCRYEARTPELSRLASTRTRRTSDIRLPCNSMASAFWPSTTTATPELVREVLEATGATVETAGFGMRALDLLEQMTPTFCCRPGDASDERIRSHRSHPSNHASGNRNTRRRSRLCALRDRTKALRSGFQCIWRSQSTRRAHGGGGCPGERATSAE